MSEKQSDLIVDPKDFPVFLKARMMGDSVEEYAAKLGVSTKLVWMLLNGKRTPSKAILQKVRLETVYRVIPDKPARAKKV